MAQLETFNNQKSPSLAGLSATKEGNSLKRGMPDWTSEDSNSQFPIGKSPLICRQNFRRFTRNPGSEIFAATSCARGIPPVSGIRGPPATVDPVGPLMIADQNDSAQVTWLSAMAAGVYVRGSGDSYDLVATNF